jgi:hypothetical protein
MGRRLDGQARKSKLLHFTQPALKVFVLCSVCKQGVASGIRSEGTLRSGASGKERPESLSQEQN